MITTMLAVRCAAVAAVATAAADDRRRVFRPPFRVVHRRGGRLFADG